MTVRDDQKEKRKQEILYAGLNLFIQKGYSGTTVKDIASAVGMSTGLLFHYFASKEELYLALVTLGIEGPMNSVRPTQMEPMAFFDAAAQQILSYIKADSFTAKMFVFMNHAYTSEDVPAGVKQLLVGFDIYTPTAGIIRQGQENGTIRQGDPLALAIAFWSAISGIAETLAMDTRLPCPQSAWIADILRNTK